MRLEFESQAMTAGLSGYVAATSALGLTLNPKP